MKKLLTLSATIDIYEDRLSKIEDTVPNESNSAKLAILQELGITVYHLNKALKQPLTLGDFIPCDSEGRPMEEPKLVGGLWENQSYGEEYEEALKAVVFEGWERSGFRGRMAAKGDLMILFQETYTTLYDNGKGCHTNTRADLARATASNPLTLKQ